MIEETPIVEIAAVIFMASCSFFTKKWVETGVACFFVIVIESITIYYNSYLDVYFNYLGIFYAYLAIVFCILSYKSSFVSAYAYVLYVAAYFLFTIEDTFMEWGVIISDSVFYGNYSAIMYGCLAILVYAVTYDRMGVNRLGAGKDLPWFSPNTHFHSENNL